MGIPQLRLRRRRPEPFIDGTVGLRLP